MAVPKKRTSKAKTRARKANWKAKARKQAQNVIYLGKSIKSGSPNFLYTE